MEQHDEQHAIFQASVDASGRVLLPAELRKAMEVEPGTSLVWIRDRDGLHLRSFEDSLADIQEYYQALAPSDVCWTDELIENRRNEAEHE